MKRFLMSAFLLVALTACGTDPNAARTTAAASESASPTLAASSPAATDSPSTLTVTRPSASANAAKTSAGLAEGTVVILPGDGVMFTTAAQINATSWLSAEAKVLMASELKRVQTGVGSCASITVTGYRVSDLVNGSEFDCPGGAAILWGKTSSGWKQIIGGQDVPMCSDVRKTGWKTTIPRDFLGGQCYEGTEVIDYKP